MKDGLRGAPRIKTIINNDYRLAASAARIGHWFHEDLGERTLERVGGPARLKVIVLLAWVLGFDAADKSTVGAIAVELEHALHIGNLQVGLLVRASTAIGAFATLPLGILADRVRRVRLLVVAVIVWSLAMAVSGGSVSFLMLLFTRLAMGAVVATAAPVIASLVGDFFHSSERGRIYGFILTGELLGAVFGFLISGNVASILSWRASFWVLAAIGLALAAALWRWLPEPARGGQSRIEPGAIEIPSHDETTGAEPSAERAHEPAGDNRLAAEIEAAGIEPNADMVLEKDPTRLSWLRAARYILSIRTNTLIIVASALGYFYITGLRTFGVVYLHARFHLSQSSASSLMVAIIIGTIVGVLIVGRVSDRLIRRGHLRARVWAGAIALLAAAGFFLPGFLVPSLYVAGALFFIAAIGIGGVNPPMDAARLDIMHSRLWGRAEGVRASLRYAFEAIAPILFGYVATFFGGSGAAFGRAADGAKNGGAGLAPTLMIMLIPLAAAGLILLAALKTYPADVATAMASEKNTAAARDA